jgi:uncharacterized protein YjbI with pentapeptide repeats
MRTTFNLQNAKTRLLIGGFILAAGAVVTRVTQSWEGPGLMTVLALALERVFGLTEHLLGHDLHKKLEERSLSPHEVLVNHDLSKAVAEAIRLACQRAALDLSELPASDRQLIESIGGSAAKHLQDVLNETNSPLQPLSEAEVVNMLSSWVHGPQGAAVLNPAGWQTLLGALAREMGVSVSEHPKVSPYHRIIKRLQGERTGPRIYIRSVEKVAEIIDPLFRASLREVLKHDYVQRGKAYVGLELTVWGELLSQYRVIRKELSSVKGDSETLLVLLRDRDLNAKQLVELQETIQQRISQVIDHMDVTDRDHHAELLYWLRRIDSEYSELSPLLPKLEEIVASLRPPDPTVGWKRYASNVKENYVRLPRSYYPYARVVGAVPLRCRVDGKYSGSLISTLVKGDRTAEGYKPILVIGEYGQGKSVACGALAAELAEGLLQSEDTGWVPVLIPLRHVSGLGALTEAELLQLHSLYGPRLSGRDFRSAQSSGRLFFILDGLDELIARNEQKDVRFYLTQFVQSHSLRANRFLVTTRPNIIGRAQQLRELSSIYEIIDIELISFQEARSYLQNRGLGDILTQLDQDAGTLFADLIKRPLFLEMIAATRATMQIAKSLRDLTEADLFGHYVRNWYERELTSVGGRLGGLKFDEIDRILSCAAYEMNQSNTDSVTEDVLDNLIRSEVTFYLRAELDHLTSQGKERLILVPDFSGNGRQFTFRHASLQSYFVSRHLHHQVRLGAAADYDARQLVSRTRFDDVVLTFFLGEISKDDRASAVLSKWYEEARRSPGYPHDALGALLLLWALRHVKKVDCGSFREFCQDSTDDVRTILVANLQGQDLSHLDLSNVKLSGANLRGAKIGETNLRAADLRNAVFDQAMMARSDLRGALVDGASFKRSDLTSADLSHVRGNHVSFESAKLGGAVLADSHLDHSTFSSATMHDANLKSASFAYSRFISAELHDAALEGSEFRSCDFTGAELFGANISQGIFIDCNVAKALADA